jgi:hypothetical protein
MAASALNPDSSRLDINLPVNDGGERAAARMAVDALRSEYTEVTVSDIATPAFVFYFEHPVTQYIYRDLIAVVTVDIPVPFNDPMLSTEVERCKLLVEEAYANANQRTQDLPPISSHALFVY